MYFTRDCCDVLLCTTSEEGAALLHICACEQMRACYSMDKLFITVAIKKQALTLVDSVERCRLT